MDVNIFRKAFRTQHNAFIDFIENNYIDFAIGKPKTLKDLHEQIKKLFPIIYEMLKESPSSEKKKILIIIIYIICLVMKRLK